MRKTKIDVRIERIEVAIKRAMEKPLKCQLQVVNHLNLLKETLILQNEKMETIFY